jgi:alkylated DNA repair dioxygenase AlkB
VNAAPAGLTYVSELVSAGEERELAERVAKLDFRDVVMHGIAARRRAAHYGWLYGYESWRIEPGPPIPQFLLPLRARAANLAQVSAEEFEEVLVTEYPPGAGIGWHRDAPMFGPKLVGVSLLSACRMRFQRGKGAERTVYALELSPRSAYVLGGEARAAWQHSIPRSPALRYSITFRTVLRNAPSPRGPSHPERARPRGAPGPRRR